MKIGSTIAKTLGVLFMLFAYGMGMWGFFFPASMMNLTLDLGLANPSAMFAERIYRRDPTIDNMFTALDMNIHASHAHHRRHARVIYFSDKFLPHDESDEFLTLVDNHMWDVSQDMHNSFRVRVANTKSRLQSAYVRSMLAKGEYRNVVNFFESERNFVNLRRPSFAYFETLSDDHRMSQVQRKAIHENFRYYAELFGHAFSDFESSLDSVTRLVALDFIHFTNEYFKFIEANQVV